ncbi:hypothetical protein PFISCL1PPCAC_28255 [Pristionchus fissidentatus]|uniref:Uncharacterized protein n=1 Tax=Pristionchus fissidentatus TaxID=1538716 RepID=A0AAV5X2W4_9BILA|nr:hypothetical protein PFISCL1PPCAC_28255 [Pristionchus fissidentatus]
MPFDKKKNVAADFDPELEAEKEYESLSNGSGGSGRKKSSGNNGNTAQNGVAPKNGVAFNGKNCESGDDAKNGDAISIGSTSQGKSVVVFKEAKASRKKRCRGVSGSSIKKDGGRFDYGMDNLDDYDDVSEEENMDDMARYIKANYDGHTFDSESDDFSNDGIRENSPLPETAVRLQKCIIEAIKDPSAQEALHSMTEVLMEFFDEKTRLDNMEKALDDMVVRDDWTTSGAVDRMAEYKCVSLLAKIIDQGLISVDAFGCHFKLNPGDSQTLRLMRSAIGFYESNAPELLGDLLKMPPKEFTDIAEDLCRSGEVSCVREALSGCPFLHADVVYQVCNNATNSMNMDLLFNASKTFKDLISEKVMTVAAINAGVSRFLTELRETEVDLPAASSLAFLLVSYCIESPACIDYNVYRKCPRPRKFLRKRTVSSGRLSIREDSNNEDCNESNYLQVA